MDKIETGALTRVLENLKAKKSKTVDFAYRVPSLWIAPGEKRPPSRKEVTPVNPYEFFIHHIETILSLGKKDKKLHYKGTKGFWISKAVVYNIFPRIAVAFDHNADGTIGGSKEDVSLNGDGIRETGTFLKTIALLGHIYSLGADVVYFLPITSIGRDGNKGDLGSPYAIGNPYELDEKLADPLCDCDITTQFKALVEACHILGMKVILEFVFRTGAKDSDWILTNPEWFYWIDSLIPERAKGMNREQLRCAYGNPVFSESELAEIKRKVDAKDFNNLPPPSEDYRKMFKLPPTGPEKVKKNRRGQFIGLSKEPDTGREVKTRIPGAFADWPPDDIQPPWTDVTYLKLYIDEDQVKPRFNYIAYNTVRMYDRALARPELANRPLWDKIRDIIPHYQETFGINGVMVDMGHALPCTLMEEIVGAARSIDPDFAFLSEDFTVDKKSLDAGYNMVLGYSWSVQHKEKGMEKLLTHAGMKGMPLSFFATSETHNTPRSATKTGGIKFSRICYMVNCFIPHGIPFIHNGYELGENYPVNTGLEFTLEELAYFREKPLPLFDRHAFDWTSDGEFCDFIEKVNSIRNDYEKIVLNTGPRTFAFLRTGNESILSFKRMISGEGKEKSIYLLVNLDYEHDREFVLSKESLRGKVVKDLVSGKEYNIMDGALRGTLNPGESLLFYHCE